MFFSNGSLFMHERCRSFYLSPHAFILVISIFIKKLEHILSNLEQIIFLAFRSFYKMVESNRIIGYLYHVGMCKHLITLESGYRRWRYIPMQTFGWPTLKKKRTQCLIQPVDQKFAMVFIRLHFP